MKKKSEKPTAKKTKRAQEKPAAPKSEPAPKSEGAKALDATRATAMALAESDVATMHVDPHAAASGVLGTLPHLEDETFRKQLNALASVGLFELTNADGLRDAALAASHAWNQNIAHRAAESEAKISAELAEKSFELRGRMFAVLKNDLLEDDPDDAKDLAAFRALLPGNSYLDRANDLVGAADLYKKRHATVSQNKRRYRETDEAEARALAEKIFEELGFAIAPSKDSKRELARRSFGLLALRYNAVRRAAHFLDPAHADERFPTLTQLARRVRPSAKKAKAESKEKQTEK